MTGTGGRGSLGERRVTHVDPKVVLLVAYRSDDGVDELRHWSSNLDFSRTITVPGIPEPVYYDHNLDAALVVTGIGNVEAGISINALLTSSAVDCSRAYFITVGAAGTTPEVGTLGSVFVNDYVLDWQQKHRWSLRDEPDERHPIGDRWFKPKQDVCKRLNPVLVRAAYQITSDVELTDSDESRRYSRRYPFAAASAVPSVAVGTSVSGTEYWHGRTCSAQAQLLASRYGAGTYSTTEMEGFGTAVALERHGLLDRYLSIRGASNFDRPFPGQTIPEKIEQDDLGLDVCLENVYRVGSSVLTRIVEDWEQWREGVPEYASTARP